MKHNFTEWAKADKIVFFIWLNDATFDRHYWSQPAQNWTTNFGDATKFDTRDAADDESKQAGFATKAEVVVQPLVVAA